MSSLSNPLFAARFLDGGGFVHNVKHPDYGAVGDGEADDTTAIQTAIDDAPRIGGIVVFPPGTYRVTSTIRVLKPIALIGAGPETSTILRTVSADRPVVQLGDRGTSYQGISVRDLGIEGSNDGTGDGLHAINLTEGDNYLRGVRIRRCAWGVTLESTFGFSISECRIGLNTVGGIRGMGQPTGGSTNQVTILNTFVKLNAGPALDIPLGKWTVLGGAFENPAAAAAPATDNVRIRAHAYSVTLAGVYVEGGNRSNIYISGAADGEDGTPRVVSIRDCYINNISAQDGALIHVGDSRNVLIDNCFFDGNDIPIEVTNAARQVVIRNMFNDTGRPVEGVGANVRID